MNGVELTLIVSHLWLLVMNPEVGRSPTTRHYIVGATFLGDGNDYSMSPCILLGFQLNMALAAQRQAREILELGPAGPADADHHRSPTVAGATLGMAPRCSATCGGAVHARRWV